MMLLPRVLRRKHELVSTGRFFTSRPKRSWCFSIEYKPEDIWIGAFWQHTAGAKPVLDVWVCLLPCLPIHIFTQGNVP